MTISDEDMLANLKLARAYAIVILRHGPNASAESSESAGDAENARAIVWEHGRRNFELREQGLLNVVLPVRDDGDIAGIGIFNTTVDEARAIMDGDPGVQAGLFVFDVHEARGFPGDALQENERTGTPPTPPG